MRKNKRKFLFVFLVMSPLTALFSIPPVIAAAAIGAGAAMLSGMMSAAAQREEQRRNRLFAAEQHSYDVQEDAIKNQNQGEQTALAQMMSGYKSALL